jgi:CheY-like chemotaxis protein
VTVLQGKRVLLVEDEALIAMLAEEMLAELGCVVHATAASVREALDHAGSGGFDVALLDVNVSRERVFPVAEALVRAGTPFAFASGYGGDEIAEPFRGYPILSKPYSTAQLQSALTAALSLKAAAG